MATSLTTMYPPKVETIMPSFCYNDSAKVWFNISSYDEDKIDQIQFIHVSMVDQRNNTNVFAGKNGNTTVYPQYYPITFNGEKNNNNNLSNKMGYDPDKQMYWLVIPPQILKTTPIFNPEQYYKVQLRFDLTKSNSSSFPAHDGYDDPTNYFSFDSSLSTVSADALQLAVYTNKNQDNFSEWSTGVLLKSIYIPSLSINFEEDKTNKIKSSTDTLIVGSLNFDNEGDNKLNQEYLSWYQIKIWYEDEERNVIIVKYNSNEIYPNSNNSINYRIDTSTLNSDLNYTYTMTITYETNNGYKDEKNYNIQVEGYGDSTTTVTSYTKDIDEDNGNITLNIKSNYTTGYLTIRRSSHYSNFAHWDLIVAYDMNKIEHQEEFEIIDNTVESMTGYQYQLQYMNNDGILYKPIYKENSAEESAIVHCDFYGGLFLDNEKTLRITFNFQPSNRANAINRTKVDTLGGQYPLFTQNSRLKYHTYSISGRISTEDNGELFLPKTEIFGDEYYNYRYPTKNILSPHTSECQSIKPNNDWLYEREYRDAVEEWLNNGKPKLFKSMTEGNMIVMLDGVSLTPDMTLGRRLYDFSATMYEIGDGKDVNSIASFGLFDIIDERPN